MIVLGAGSDPGILQAAIARIPPVNTTLQAHIRWGAASDFQFDDPPAAQAAPDTVTGGTIVLADIVYEEISRELDPETFDGVGPMPQLASDYERAFSVGELEFLGIDKTARLTLRVPGVISVTFASPGRPNLKLEFGGRRYETVSNLDSGGNRGPPVNSQYAIYDGAV